MASQDDTPQQHPASGGSAEPEQNLSDASETIVRGDHAVGTDPAAAADGGAATGGPVADGGTGAGLPDDGIDHDDWDAAFADASGADAAFAAASDANASGLAGSGKDSSREDSAGQELESRTESAAVDQPGRPGTAADVEVVPGGHPSLAQRSTLPMRRASTMPNVSGYGELSAEEQEQAGSLDAALPARSSAAGGFDAAAGSDAADRSAGVSRSTAGDSRSAKQDGAAAGSSAVSAFAAGTGTAAGATAAAAAAATPSAPSSAMSGAGAGAHRSEAPATHARDAGKTTALQTAALQTTSSGQATAESTAFGQAAEEEAAPEHTEDAASEQAAHEELSAEEARRRAEERERAGMAKPVLARVLQVMIAVFFPVMLLAAAIRAVATPLFLWVEYHRPGFPADSYGFSTDDRMTYGSYAVDYLLNFSGPRYLGDLVTAGGEPLYLASEVSHMADVKTVLTVAFVAALVMAVLSLLACFYLAKRSPGGIRRAFFSGSVVTLVLVGALIVVAVLGWENFFTQVHAIFFANGNWTFRMDDTLIRLFPAQFWMDCGIAIAGLVLLTCVAVLVAAWPTRTRRERSRLKAEAARRRYLDSLDAV